VARPLNPGRGVALFTDGSAWYKDGSGGWAWIAIDAFGSEEQGAGACSDTTNNRMELTAAIRGLEHLNRIYGRCDVLLYSDSEYMVLGSRDRFRSRKKNRDLWEQLDHAADNHSVEWLHVKGHADSYYNDLCDKMASEVRKNGKIV
jgi:ribonuclease HI